MDTPVPDSVALEVVAEVLSQALDDMDDVAVDVGHITGGAEPEVELSLTSNWGSLDNLLLTLWHTTDEGPVSIGVFSATLRRVI